MVRKQSSQDRAALGRVARARYEAGETWRAIGADLGWDPTTVRKAAEASGPVQRRRWGSQPVADPAAVLSRRQQGASIPALAREFGCSQTAIRTALEAATSSPSATRYPRLSERRSPTAQEIVYLRGLYEACPPLGPRGARATAGPEGLVLAQECRRLVDDGVPMQPLSVALGRTITWVHWLLGRHDLLPPRRPARSTMRRTLPSP